MKSLNLKHILLEIQRESHKRPELLEELETYLESDNYKTKLDNIADEILNEYRHSLVGNDVEQVKIELKWSDLGGGWDKNKNESFNNYKERVFEAEDQLSTLIDNLKLRIKTIILPSITEIPGITSLDDDTLKQLIKTLMYELSSSIKMMLMVLSKYPFKW